MTKIKTSTGITLDTDYGYAKELTEYAADKGLTEVRCFYSVEPNMYVLYDGERPVTESQQAETIAVRIDMMAMVKE